MYSETTKNWGMLAPDQALPMFISLGLHPLILQSPHQLGKRRKHRQAIQLRHAHGLLRFPNLHQSSRSNVSPDGRGIRRCVEMPRPRSREEDEEALKVDCRDRRKSAQIPDRLDRMEFNFSVHSRHFILIEESRLTWLPRYARA